MIKSITDAGLNGCKKDTLASNSNEISHQDGVAHRLGSLGRLIQDVLQGEFVEHEVERALAVFRQLGAATIKRGCYRRILIGQQ